MRAINYLMSACLVTITSVGFVSCSDDDEKTEVKPVAGIVAPSVTETLGITTPVTSMGSGISFNYNENGRMVGGTYDGSVLTISSNPLAISETYESTTSVYKLNYTNFYVNSMGFMTSCDFHETDAYYTGSEWDDYEYTGTITASYDGDGHIIQFNIEGTYYYHEDGTTATEKASMTHVWNDGNLVKIIDNGSGEDWTYQAEITYTYAENASENINTGIYLPDINDYITDYFWYTGLLGKTTRNIPIKESYWGQEKWEGGEDTDSQTRDIIVTYTDGLVSSLTEIHEDGYNNYYYFGYGNNNAQVNAVTPLLKSKGQKMAKRLRGRKLAK